MAEQPRGIGDRDDDRLKTARRQSDCQTEYLAAACGLKLGADGADVIVIEVRFSAVKLGEDAFDKHIEIDAGQRVELFAIRRYRHFQSP